MKQVIHRSGNLPGEPDFLFTGKPESYLGDVFNPDRRITIEIFTKFRDEDIQAPSGKIVVFSPYGG